MKVLPNSIQFNCSSRIGSSNEYAIPIAGGKARIETVITKPIEVFFNQLLDSAIFQTVCIDQNKLVKA